MLFRYLIISMVNAFPFMLVMIGFCIAIALIGGALLTIITSIDIFISFFVFYKTRSIVLSFLCRVMLYLLFFVVMYFVNNNDFIMYLKYIFSYSADEYIDEVSFSLYDEFVKFIDLVYAGFIKGDDYFPINPYIAEQIVIFMLSSIVIAGIMAFFKKHPKKFKYKGREIEIFDFLFLVVAAFYTSILLTAIICGIMYVFFKGILLSLFVLGLSIYFYRRKRSIVRLFLTWMFIYCFMLGGFFAFVYFYLHDGADFISFFVYYVKKILTIDFRAAIIVLLKPVIVCIIFWFFRTLKNSKEQNRWWIILVMGFTMFLSLFVFVVFVFNFASAASLANSSVNFLYKL